MNKIHNVQNESIEQVFLEMDAGDNHEWRKESGLLLTGTRTLTPDNSNQIWGSEGYRVFLSHKSEVKKETGDLQDRLRLFGIAAFVAHKDIHPTKLWQDEIENALGSMDAFVALMTETFHESDWTDQEVGFAFARGVPIIAVRLGKDPYGFIGRFQGLTTTWRAAAEEIVKILVKKDRMFAAYVKAIRDCPTWDAGNILGKALPGLESLSAQQIDELVSAYNNTSELRGSFAFNGSKPNSYGPGLVSHLNRLGAGKFKLSKSELIERVT